MEALGTAKMEYGNRISSQMEVAEADYLLQRRSSYNITVPVYDISLKSIFAPFFRKIPLAAVRAMVLAGTFLVLATAAVLMYQLHPQFEQLHLERVNNAWGLAFVIITVSLLAFKLGFYLFNLMLYLRYKPVEAVSDELLPMCTVIVPAYNEGEQVWHTLASLAASDYPTEKLQLIAIDDGSRDDTWQWMLSAKEQLGDRLEICRQPRNMGKRQALYRGFHMGEGEVFVTVDSDSEVKPDTLRNMVSPFVRNKK